MRQKQFLLALAVLFSAFLCAQDSAFVVPKPDSVKTLLLSDSVSKAIYIGPTFRIVNKLLNHKAKAVSFASQIRDPKSKDSIFYLLAGLIFYLALLKFLYSRYFTNLFRVFFNSSLRQSQLTDQLLQAKFSSMMFNFFFFISGGVFVYLLLIHYNLITKDNQWLMILSSILLMAGIYLIKYCTLKFTGWVTGLKEATNTYVFILFLINKILGVFLLPFAIIFAFSDHSIVSIAAIISIMCVGIFLFLRFFRSYGILQNQLKITRFHFILYVSGIEILPLLLIYKSLLLFLAKKM